MKKTRTSQIFLVVVYGHIQEYFTHVMSAISEGFCYLRVVDIHIFIESAWFNIISGRKYGCKVIDAFWIITDHRRIWSLTQFFWDFENFQLFSFRVFNGLWSETCFTLECWLLLTWTSQTNCTSWINSLFWKGKFSFISRCSGKRTSVGIKRQHFARCLVKIPTLISRDSTGTST